MIVRLQVDRDVAAAVGLGTRRRLVAVATRAGRRLGLATASLRTLGLRVVGDATMIELHRRHLGTAVPTDVLSFPGDDDGDGDGDGDSDGDDEVGIGDIAIDWDQVRRQAMLAGPEGWCDEAAQLVVHGLAHLVGHDHARRPEGRRMLRAEIRAARSAAVAVPVRPYGGRG
jgi:probable rRNA maturation factor